MATHVSLRLFFWWPATKCGEVLYLPLPPYKQPVYHIYVRTSKQGDFRLVVYNILDKIMHINTKIHLLSLLTLHPLADFSSWWETVSSWFEVVPISCLVSTLKPVIRIIFISPGRGRALSPLANMLLMSDAVRSQDLAQQGHQEPVSQHLKGTRHQLDAVTAR